MRATLAVLISAILAALAGFIVQQLALVIDPTTGPIARDCIGAAVFATVLFMCLVVVRRQAEEN